MLKVKLFGRNKNNVVKVNGEGELSVVVHPHPPQDEETASLPFQQYFTTDGTSSGATDMKVNGSVTNQEFYIKAASEYDIYIGSIAILIADAGATMNNFGNITALTNGLKFSYFSNETGELVIHDNLVSNFEFVRLSLGNPPFGSGTSAFRASNVVSTSEAFMPVIDLALTFKMPYGLRLKKNTTAKVGFTVRDDVTGVDQFDIIGYGIRL